MTNDYKSYYFNTASSTMDEAKKLAQNNSAIFSVIALQQSNGRGRNARQWVQATLPLENLNNNYKNRESEYITYNSLSQALQNSIEMLPVTFVFPTDKIFIPLEWISLAVGCALFDATCKIANTLINSIHTSCNTYANLAENLRIKWPNDLIYITPNNSGNYKKIAGILCESQLNENKQGFICIGIGYNLFYKPTIDIAECLWNIIFPDTIKNSTNNTKKLLKDSGFKTQIVMQFAETLQHEIHDYLTTPRNTKQLRDLVINRSISSGTLITVDGGKLKGEFLGIDTNGRLLISGNNNPILSGDIDFYRAAPQADKINNEKNDAPLDKNLEKGYLAIDYGNTRMHWKIQENTSTYGYGEIDYSALKNPSDYNFARIFRSILNIVSKYSSGNIDILIASVLSSANTHHHTHLLLTFLKTHFPKINFNLFKISSDLILQSINLQNQYNANEIGIDRALRFLFASQFTLKNSAAVAIFSAGTALTCEVLDKNNNIIDSLIAPGLDMALRAMHEFTAKLPKINITLTEIIPNNQQWNTQISMQRGVVLSTLSLIKNILELHKIKHAFICGGNAQYLIELFNQLYADNIIVLTFVANLETTMLVQFGENNSLKQELSGDNTEKNSLITNNNFKNLSNNKAVMPILASLVKKRRKSRQETLGNNEISTDDFRRLGSRIEGQIIGVRLDQYLSQKFKFHSRSEWKRRILSREVFIEPKAPKITEIPSIYTPKTNWIKHTYKTNNLDQLWIFQPDSHEPDHINTCEVIADDGDVVVFSKPGNLVIHAVGQYCNNTFLNVIAKMGYKNAAPIHRIDRETSGVLVCARSTLQRNRIAQAFKDHQMQKMYFAVCKLDNFDIPDLFRVESSIGDAIDSKIRLKLWINGPNAVPASTYFKVLSKFNSFALIACFPQTGRTNQIRIHLASIGAWIVGDKMYHHDEEIFLEFYDKGLTDNVLQSVLFPRQLLHNVAIASNHGNMPEMLKSPVISVLPDDFIAFDKTIDLLNMAEIPLEPQAQQKACLDIFITYSNYDFSNAPVLSSEN